MMNNEKNKTAGPRRSDARGPMNGRRSGDYVRKNDSDSGRRNAPAGKQMPHGAGKGLKPAWNGRGTGRPNGTAPAKKAAKPPVEGMPARRLALKVIRQVTEQGAYASLALDGVLEGCGLSAVDRHLVTRLVYDTLDHMIYLDWVLGQVMAREDTDIKLRNILRLGACQILLEDRIPESAATNTSVQLCEELGMEGLKGVCNGILRNLVRKKEEIVFPDAGEEPVRAASIRYSMPEWLWVRLVDAYGADEAGRIASFRLEDACWTIRPNLTRISDQGMEEMLEKKIWTSEKTDIPHAWRIRGAMDIARDADFSEGNFSIMSESSMMACMAMNPGRGKQILDCCAAPGGKTCYMAELMSGTGRVQAWDVHEHRVKLIEAQAKRLGLENIRPMTRDALRVREDMRCTMDGVLLDAPCSGLGVLAEKPDIKLRVTEKSIQELTDIQCRLLDTVCEYVKVGGILVYSTCSILPEENEEQILSFLSRHPEFEACPMPETIPERFRQHQRKGLQLLEHRDGVEGFYICRLRRKG